MNGHLDVLKYLHENGCPWNERCCEKASEKGHLECIIYLHKNRCPWNEKSCEKASDNGHFKVLKYLHENGCPLVLKYLHETAKNYGEDSKSLSSQGESDNVPEKVFGNVLQQCFSNEQMEEIEQNCSQIRLRENIRTTTTMNNRT